MPVRPSLRRGLMVLAALVAVPSVSAAVTAPVRVSKAEPSADDAFLDGLQGRWFMVGSLDGRPVHYRAEGRRVLQGGFLRVRLTDVAARPQYEADVFIGFDPKARDYIVHWLDRFAAAGARVVGKGEREGDQLVVIFPADEGDFRDTFTWHPLSRTWSLLIESEGINGEWSTFASFMLSRDSRR